MHIRFMLFIAWLLFFTSTTFVQQQAEAKIFPKQTYFVTTKDSIKLATDVYLPKKIGSFPCILIRSPYNKKNSAKESESFTKDGYAVVIQDTRGKFESEGKFYPLKYERQDGLATVKWIRSQPWSNGKIAGWGGSYVGYTQWAIADELDAMTPVVTSAHMYELMYPNGIFSLATAFNWGLVVDSKTINPIPPEKVIAAYSILPLSVADDSTYKQNDFLNDWLSHPFDDAYWGAMNHRFSDVCPMYSIAGWYDIFLESQIRDFVELGDQRHPDSRLVVGPFAHGKIDIETDWGKNGNIYRNRDDIMSFLATHLRVSKTERKPQKPFSLFIIHRNEWVESETWPPEDCQFTPYYFASGNNLIKLKENQNDTVSYTYDPLNPYNSIGGTYLGTGVGPAFQNPNKDRTDQIVFESAPLEQPLVLLGPIDATIYASTDAPSADFFVSLHEVRANSQIINIQEGGSRIYSDPLAQPRPQRIDISLWASGYQINGGHRLRIVISSSLFPRYNRNLNSGEKIFDAHDSRRAEQTIFFGEKYPSHVRLPVWEPGD